MKSYLKIIIAIVIGVLLGSIVSFIMKNDKCDVTNDLPKQEKSEGLRGVYDIDKNINEKTIDNYLDRSDVVYRDVRMLEDTATWETKGEKEI